MHIHTRFKTACQLYSKCKQLSTPGFLFLAVTETAAFNLESLTYHTTHLEVTHKTDKSWQTHIRANVHCYWTWKFFPTGIFVSSTITISFCCFTFIGIFSANEIPYTVYSLIEILIRGHCFTSELIFMSVTVNALVIRINYNIV